MKKIITVIIVLSVIYCFNSCKQAGNDQTAQVQTSTIDTTLIKKFGADEYGYKQFILVFYKNGPRHIDTAQAATVQVAHLKYLKGLMDKGKIIILGPTMEENEIRGICIYDCKTVGEAKAFAEADPAVTSGEMMIEAHPWYGSAAILCVPEMHKKLERKSFADMK